MVHCKNWDRQLLKVLAKRDRKRNKPVRCRSRVEKTQNSMDMRT